MKPAICSALIVALLQCGCNANPNQRLAYFAGKSLPQSQVRKAEWAQPVQVQGVPNIFMVSPAFYRGSQPSDDGWANLRAIGVKTVVTVRWLHASEDLVRQSGMSHEWIRMKAWAPTDDQIVQFLQILNNPDRTPIFVQCYTGSDRAGLLTAVYRITMCGWSKDQAIEEMLTGGYDFHQILRDIYVRYIETMDVETIRQRAGLVGYVAQRENVAQDAKTAQAMEKK